VQGLEATKDLQHQWAHFVCSAEPHLPALFTLAWTLYRLVAAYIVHISRSLSPLCTCLYVSASVYLPLCASLCVSALL
jgi:hypothetical protein